MYGNIYSIEEQRVYFTGGLQLTLYSYQYANWNSFENRFKWTSSEAAQKLKEQFPKNAFHVSLPFSARVSFIYLQGY